MDHEKENSGMGERGVSRPMPLHHNQSQKMKMGDPLSWQRQKMMQTHHQQTLWVYWSLVITLGSRWLWRLSFLKQTFN